MIKFELRGSFNNTERFLKRMRTREIYRSLNHYGRVGVEARLGELIPG